VQRGAASVSRRRRRPRRRTGSPAHRFGARQHKRIDQIKRVRLTRVAESAAWLSCGARPVLEPLLANSHSIWQEGPLLRPVRILQEGKAPGSERAYVTLEEWPRSQFRSKPSTPHGMNKRSAGHRDRCLAGLWWHSTVSDRPPATRWHSIRATERGRVSSTRRGSDGARSDFPIGTGTDPGTVLVVAPTDTKAARPSPLENPPGPHDEWLWMRAVRQDCRHPPCLVDFPSIERSQSLWRPARCVVRTSRQSRPPFSYIVRAPVTAASLVSG